MKQLGGMKVPLVDLGAQYATIRDDVIAAVTRVCDSQRYVLGPEVELAEKYDLFTKSTGKAPRRRVRIFASDKKSRR